MSSQGRSEERSWAITYLCKQRGLLPRVTEGVNVPGHTGAPIFAKRVFQEAQPKRHLVYDGSVVGGCLIVHHPATVGKLQASCARKGKVWVDCQGQDWGQGWQCRGYKGPPANPGREGEEGSLPGQCRQIWNREPPAWQASLRFSWR